MPASTTEWGLAAYMSVGSPGHGHRPTDVSSRDQASKRPSDGLLLARPGRHRPDRVRGRGNPGRRRSITWLLRLAAVALVIIPALAFALLRTTQAGRAGLAGRRSVLQAEANLHERDFAAAHRDLLRAGSHFSQARSRVAALGPLGPILRVTPVVSTQLTAIETITEIGILVAHAGLAMADAGQRAADLQDANASISDALASLQQTTAVLDGGLGTLDAAAARGRSLRGLALVGPLRDASRQVRQELPRMRARVAGLREGLGAFSAFAGAKDPKRYLIFSLNPDELRPVGGFIGTYGVLSAANGHLSLERYDSIESWYLPRPDAVAPPERAGPAFTLQQPPIEQTIANVNDTADWPTAARLAAELWEKGGEQPVDGVIGMTPEFLARMLRVLGPVTLPGYQEVVTADNVVEKVDFYSHQVPPGQNGEDRKRFIAVLAQAVLERLVAAPSSRWEALGVVLGQAFDAREAVAWSKDAEVAPALARRSWDGQLPAVEGDFFYDGEFEYLAKNGRSLHRVFEHDVTLRADGSARVATTITIANTKGPDSLRNVDAVSLVTIYGPQGGTLNPESDSPIAVEDPVAGHPVAAWLRVALPLDSTAVRVVWEVPNLLIRKPDGAWEYRLRWMRIAAHTGDLLRLHVTAPEGWHWVGPAPPESSDLTRDVVGGWLLTPDGRRK